MTQKGSVDNFLGPQLRDLTIQEHTQQPTHRTDGNNSVSQFHHNHSNSQGANVLHQANSSFRVENRRARPKIIQNVVDQGNAFFSKQANILNTS